jgi:hypothetical protein
VRWNPNGAPAALAQCKAAALPPGPGPQGAVQRMLSTDFVRRLDPDAKIIQVPYQRPDLSTAAKGTVDGYDDGTGTGVYKHFIPNNWLHKIFEAAVSDTKVGVTPSVANRLIGQTLPPARYETRGRFRLPIADVEDFGDGDELTFKTALASAVTKFADNPRNIFRGDGDGAGAGSKIDIPTVPTEALKNRLTKFAIDLIQQADVFLRQSDVIIYQNDDWDAMKAKIETAIEELNSR